MRALTLSCNNKIREASVYRRNEVTAREGIDTRLELWFE